MCSRGKFQSWWSDRYRLINEDSKGVCVLCLETAVCRSGIMKSIRNLFLIQDDHRQYISQVFWNKSAQTVFLMKYIGTHQTSFKILSLISSMDYVVIHAWCKMEIYISQLTVLAALLDKKLIYIYLQIAFDVQLLVCNAWLIYTRYLPTQGCKDWY